MSLKTTASIWYNPGLSKDYRLESVTGSGNLNMPAAKLLAILNRQDIEGDEALLRLAQERFSEAGVGGEFYPGNPLHLQKLLPFRPRGLASTVHLPRSLDLVQPGTLERVMEFASCCAGQADGMILHDSRLYEEKPEEAFAAMALADERLGALPNAPMLFIEYAAGLSPDTFASIFENTKHLGRISACIDVSHVGIKLCQTAYARNYPGVDVCSLRSRMDLQDSIDGIQAAAGEALQVVSGLIARLVKLGKPLHYHLHDGHPLSTLSKYGVADHLSFLQEIRIPVAYKGRRVLPGMFGIPGLFEIVRAATQGQAGASLMIEVHPQEGRSSLGAHAGLFSYWRDKTNAERMNYWIDSMLSNAVLIRHALQNQP